MERLDRIIARLAGTRSGWHGPVPDMEVYFCCDDCPVWSSDRQPLAVHRVSCETFNQTVLARIRGEAALMGDWR